MNFFYTLKYSIILVSTIIGHYSVISQHLPLDKAYSTVQSSQLLTGRERGYNAAPGGSGLLSCVRQE